MSNKSSYTMMLLRKFEAAVRAHEMKGAAAPEDMPIIEKEYQRAKEKLVRKIGQLCADNK